MMAKNKYTISEIKDLLEEVKTEEDDLFQEFLLDDRKGVQKALQSWRKRKDLEEKIKDQFVLMNQFENELYEEGYQLVGGVDEVGRGPLAGPVVCACVVLDPHHPIYGLRDSKQLSLKKREELFVQIKEHALSYGIGQASPEEIDRYNIYQATKLAMQRAINDCGQVDYVLIDAMTLDLPVPQRSIIKGDDKSNSIAASSILAKVTRDRLMIDYSEEFPGYGFQKNAGYGTKEHLEGLKQFGAVSIHRKSFAPVKENL